MNFYHASDVTDFKIILSKTSRYSFSALFFTENYNLALLYQKKNKGCIIKIETTSFEKVIDYQFKSSYSLDFRNLIYALKKENLKNILIKNVIDYPSQKNKVLQHSDILIFFDLKSIPNFTIL